MFRNATDSIMEKVVFICGILTIVFVVLIFGFLFKEGFSFFKEYGIFNFLTGKLWYPTSNPAMYGVLSLIVGSLLVTLGAIAIAVPLGIMAALYIAEIAPAWIRDILKSGVELMAAIPSVVIGFVGMVTLVPVIRTLFDIPTGLTAFSGSIMLAFMAMPTIVSISEDAIRSVPWSYKEGAYALGATKWQTIRRIVLKTAMPGIIAAVMLGIGRVIGETMAVMMITGNAAHIPSSIFEPVRTLTATIAAEMGETVKGGLHYRALFAIGLVLFAITFIINFIADLFLNKNRK
ncbi:MAG: phosphate ABC transporter permease subunit PstC [Endomicrobiaceae bacterium]|jgi:phosphate transport system permease protein|nr:phosphate ABC transporter permease subunit PstC [Endomicrobiaceae bacterium]MDD3729776.1 phosphate ABC transporter permease subunit PstC [Endomicrobiaceae bacterium]MDD4166018.1 phosphate ABC transporter permease subunit PstC [Endomicrobiaceae bacterium]